MPVRMGLRLSINEAPETIRIHPGAGMTGKDPSLLTTIPSAPPCHPNFNVANSLSAETKDLFDFG
jgi:hypothetical protein